MSTLVRQRAHVDWQALRNVGAPELDPNVPRSANPDEPLLVLDGDGAPQLLCVRFPWTDLLERARAAVDSYPRGSVRRSSGTSNECSTFGYLAGNAAMRRYGCRACGASIAAPREHAVVCQLAEPLFQLLAAHLPEQAASDLQLSTAIGEDWRIEGSPWTSGVLNYDSPLPYHRDANNLKTWSAMVCWRRRVNGGNLHVPELDLVLPVRDGEVVFFPGWALGHAVTPLTVKAGGYRRTAVFYTVSKMRNCPPADEQLVHAQAARSAQEDNWRERQRAAGLLVEDGES